MHDNSKNIILSIELLDYTRFFMMKSHISRWISKKGNFIISIISRHISVFAGFVKVLKLFAIIGIIFLETVYWPNL